MQKGRKILALTLAVLLVLSAMTCFSFAAPVYSVLPEGYLVVNTTWQGMQQQEAFDFELGGELYNLEYGVTAFSSVEAATSVWLPGQSDRTIVLAPGTYASNMTLTSDITLCGPYFGKNPNNNPNASDYDPSMPAWALKNDRSIDPAKEAVFTGSLIIGTGCNDVTVDGIAFTGNGRIYDSRTNQAIEVEYNFKNLYFKDSTNVNYIQANSGDRINRYVYIDSCRMENGTSITNPVPHNGEVIEITNTYMNGLGTGENNVQMYLSAIPATNSLSADRTLRASYIGNHFENITGINFINFADRNSGAGGNIADRTRVILEVRDNEFVEVSTGSSGGGITIQDQIATKHQELYVTGNRFIRTSTAYSTGVNVYHHAADDASPYHINAVVKNNYFEGYDAPVQGTTGVFLYDVGPNYYVNKEGERYEWTSKYNTAVDGVVYDETLKYSSVDFDMLNSSIGAVKFSGTESNRTATVYLEDNAKQGVPTFYFRGEEVTYGVYSDAQCTAPLASDFVAEAGKTIYVKATESTYSCVYTVNITNEVSNMTRVYAYGDAEVMDYSGNPANSRLYITLDDAGDGYYVFPEAKDINVSTGATCEVYAAIAENDGEIVTVGNPINRIALTEKETLAYLKVTAPDGTIEYWDIYIFCHPAENIDDGNESSSSCELFDLDVAEATQVTKIDDEQGWIVIVEDGVKSITPKLTKSAKSTYQFYMDKECMYPASTTDVVKLNSLVNTFYIQIIAENGEVSDAIPVTVYSPRGAAKYTDSANIPSYAKKAVNYLNDHGYGIFTGDEQGKLNPRANITRYELAKVMVVLSGINVDMAESVKLNEIYDDFYEIQGKAAWAIPYIRAATAAGLIQGVAGANGDLYFDGSAYTTREQFATVFMRSVTASANTSINKVYNNNKTNVEKAFKGKFNDAAKISSWALKSVKLATYFGYVQGDGYNFNPNSNIIRADVAVIIYNATGSK